MKMSFTPSPLTVTAILKHQDKAKSAGERHTRSDAMQIKGHLISRTVSCLSQSMFRERMSTTAFRIFSQV